MAILYNKDIGSWKSIIEKQYNAMIIKNAWNPELSNSMKIHPFFIKCKKNEINFFKLNESFCSLLKNFMGKMISNFKLISNSYEYFIKLEHITNDACRAFHADNLDKRLICTIFGSGGTQWVNDDNVNYKYLHTHFHNYEEKNNFLIKDMSQICTADIGDVLVMKGLGSNAKHSFIHRSYPLKHNEDRWVFTISEKFI